MNGSTAQPGLSALAGKVGDGSDTEAAFPRIASFGRGPGQRPAAGARISNLKALAPSGHGRSGLGTLGFLAATAGARDWRSLVLVSNRHVLLAEGAGSGDFIFQPTYKVADDGRLSFDADTVAPIAIIENEGREGDFEYTTPGETVRSYFVDCATARLIEPQFGACPRGPALFAGTARVHPLDAVPGRELRVRMLGQDPRAAGKVVSVDATVVGQDGRLRRNNLVIRSLSCRAAGRPFCGPGDSGALIVDAHNRAVGLLWGVNLDDPTEAYACHIHPVLACLGLTPWRFAFQTETALNRTGPAAEPAAI